MGFADVLKLYLDKTKCTAKELSAASGISASALSGYRSGKRIPEQEQIEKLICGFVQLASENTPELDEAIIRNAFSTYTDKKPEHDYQAIIQNLNTAIMSDAHFPEADRVRETEIISLPKYYYGFDEMKL